MMNTICGLNLFSLVYFPFYMVSLSTVSSLESSATSSSAPMAPSTVLSDDGYDIAPTSPSVIQGLSIRHHVLSSSTWMRGTSGSGASSSNPPSANLAFCIMCVSPRRPQIATANGAASIPASSIGSSPPSPLQAHLRHHPPRLSRCLHPVARRRRSIPGQ